MWSTDKDEISSLKIPILLDFQLKAHSVCTMTWEGFTSVVLNRCEFEIEMWQIAVFGQLRRNRYNQYSPTYAYLC